MKERALKLIEAGRYEEVFGLLTTQVGGEVILNELLTGNDPLLDAYVDWFIGTIGPMLQNKIFFEMACLEMKQKSPQQYLFFKLIDRGARAGGNIPVAEFRQLVRDLFGQAELDHFEWHNPGIFERETITVKECLKGALNGKFRDLAGIGRA